MEHPTRESLINQMKGLVTGPDDAVSCVQMQPIVGRLLQFSPKPYSYLKDGDEMIPLFDMPSEITMAANGFLITEENVGDPLVVLADSAGQTAVIEEDAPEEEPQQEESDQDEDDAAFDEVSEDDDDDVGAVIAGAISANKEEDAYGDEPPLPESGS